MTNLKATKKRFGSHVLLISKATSMGFAIHNGLRSGNKKMLLNSHRAVVKSFTKNFQPRKATSLKQAQQIAQFGRKGTNKVGQRQPIDSGKMRQSVKHQTTGDATGEVSLNTDYAIHVEFGTVNMEARPVFRTGMKDVEKENTQILIDEVNKKTK